MILRDRFCSLFSTWGDLILLHILTNVAFVCAHAAICACLISAKLAHGVLVGLKAWKMCSFLFRHHSYHPFTTTCWLQKEDMVIQATSQSLQDGASSMSYAIFLNSSRNSTVNRPPFWIFKLWYFVMWPFLERESASAHQISLKMDDSRLRYGDKTIFKMASVRHLEFMKFGILVTWPVSEHYSTSLYQILHQSDKKSLRYSQKWFTIWWPSSILN